MGALLFLLLALAGPSQAQTLTFEAENGVLRGGAQAAAGAGTGYVQGLNQEVDGVEITVSVPETDFYDLAIRQASLYGGYKENYVLLDGAMVGTAAVSTKAFDTAVLERQYLTRGEHVIGIFKYWGGVKIDTVSLTPAPPLREGLFDIPPTLVNENASDNALRLMHYLCDLYGEKILSGQYCGEGMYGMENAAIWRATGGQYPAVLGLDLIEYSPSRVQNGSTSKAVEYAIEYWNKGGIVTLTWHWNAPETYLTGLWYKGFYSEAADIDLATVMNGEDEAGYALLLRDIDAIAVQLKRLQDAGVPVLWRPLHEASGGWFWWGAAGSDAYLKLYTLLYDRLTDVHGLNNLIWVWNGQDPAWYPGDDKVDIIGEDIYPGERVYTPQTAKFMEATHYSGADKMIVLSENGCLFDPELAARDGAMWGLFCTWGGEFVLENQKFNYLSEQYTEAAMVKKVYASDIVITRSDLPDLKTYPLP